ncbi:hypothetical protein R3P38DRAFT_3268371 [Favolaschia claudopus]|uniref:Uncharacterized protein n=1 Tax=Favolaschia claudopus TaxID=2862362 RepID=A0AAW0BL97_9AGAR
MSTKINARRRLLKLAPSAFPPHLLVDYGVEYAPERPQPFRLPAPCHRPSPLQPNPDNPRHAALPFLPSPALQNLRVRVRWATSPTAIGSQPRRQRALSAADSHSRRVSACSDDTASASILRSPAAHRTNGGARTERDEKRAAGERRLTRLPTSASTASSLGAVSRSIPNFPIYLRKYKPYYTPTPRYPGIPGSSNHPLRRLRLADASARPETTPRIDSAASARAEQRERAWRALGRAFGFYVNVKVSAIVSSKTTEL